MRTRKPPAALGSNRHQDCLDDGLEDCAAIGRRSGKLASRSVAGTEGAFGSFMILERFNLLCSLRRSVAKGFKKGEFGLVKSSSPKLACVGQRWRSPLCVAHLFPHFFSDIFLSAMRILTTALVLASLSFQAWAAPSSKGAKTPKAPKEPKTTAANLVEQEGALPSPIKPLASASAAEMAARFFSEALKPYGEWLEVGQFGRCWRPAGVGERWAPYTVGSWAYSRFGWTWVSDEDFGGIVYHYGRWFRLEGAGWCWVPDLEWAASWVSWRYGSELVGWAPLPPKAKWDPHTGIGVWADRDYETGPDNYVFCQVSELSDPQLSEVLYPPSANTACFNRSVSTTNLSALGKAIFCGGPAYNWAADRAKGGLPVIRVLKERSLVKFREQLNEAVGAAVSFKSEVKGDRLTTVAPEWGVLADPRRAEALGFNVDTVEEVKIVKWSEARPGEVPQEVEDGADGKAATPREVVTLTGWERIPENVRKALRLKVIKEVGGLTSANTPAAPFDPERDFPTAR